MTVSREFFGMMYNGFGVDPSGNFIGEPYIPIPVGTIRPWDTGAVLTTLLRDGNLNRDGLNGQVRFAENIGARVIYAFGFSAHWIEHPEVEDWYKPSPEALILGSRNRPTREYLSQAADAVLNFSLADPTKPRIQIYELWNEPAVGSHYWDAPPETSVKDLYDQCVFLYQKIKERQTGAIVLSPSFNALDLWYGMDFATRYVALMRQLGPACDAIAFHMYPDTVDSIHVQLAALDKAIQGFNHFDKYCTEYNGPWEAYDILANREDMKCLVLNGQQKPSPYESELWAKIYTDMVNRLETVGPTPSPAPKPNPPKDRGGCLFMFGNLFG